MVRWQISPDISHSRERGLVVGLVMSHGWGKRVGLDDTEKGFRKVT